MTWPSYLTKVMQVIFLDSSILHLILGLQILSLQYFFFFFLKPVITHNMLTWFLLFQIKIIASFYPLFRSWISNHNISNPGFIKFHLHNIFLKTSANSKPTELISACPNLNDIHSFNYIHFFFDPEFLSFDPEFSSYLTAKINNIFSKLTLFSIILQDWYANDVFWTKSVFK